MAFTVGCDVVDIGLAGGRGVDCDSGGAVLGTDGLDVLCKILVGTGEDTVMIVGFEVGADCIVGDEGAFAASGFFYAGEVGVLRALSGTLAGGTTRGEVCAVGIELMDD